MLTDYNNLYRFIDTKSLSSRQVYLAHELSKYHFRIDYRQGKANEAIDALFCFLQRNEDEKEKVWTENTQLLHCLQSSLTNATLLGLSTSSSLSLLYQVLNYRTHALKQLRQFWNSLWIEPTNEGLYLASIYSIKLRLQELWKTNSET